MIVECTSCGAKNRVPAARLGDAPKCAACKLALKTAAPLHVHTVAELDELLRDAKVPVVVDYWASWCGPCRTVAPELEKLASERGAALIVAKVDTEALPEVAGRFGIRSIPTFILFEHGKESKRVSGAMPKAALAAQLGV